MKIVVAFFQAASSLGQKDELSLGSFEMPSVPDVGETVIIDDAAYTVESRLWQPGRRFSQVTIMVTKKQ